jgi:radical SAM superfamily enzyme YgiQ (UPF0313 family)
MPGKLFSLFHGRLAKEKGGVTKDWGGRITVALAYPNHYRIGMSNLGFLSVYKLLNEREDVVAERVFLPDSEEMSLHMGAGKGLLSMESLSPLIKFDLIAFSLSFENDYPNILKILRLSRIPYLSRERDEAHPLIMAGGINTFLNPEPLASFFDFFLLGEAEAALYGFIDLFAGLRRRPPPRPEFLRILAREVPSLYVPSLYHVSYSKDGTIRAREPTENSVPTTIEVSRLTLTAAPVTTSSILTPETEFPDRILVELGRGCARSCRFCAAGYVYRPPRFHQESDLLSCVETLSKKSDHIGLLSTSASDTPGLERITEWLATKGCDFSISSLRADSLTKPLIEHLWKAGQRTVAIAPEAGSERLRKVVNKHLREEQIIRAVRLIAAVGDFRLRLYFLIGLPTETMDDVAEIIDLIKSIKHHIIKESGTRGKIRQMKLSVNCFIPKPFTPFQWFPMESASSLKQKQKWLKNALGREGGIKVSLDLPKWAYVQTLLSVGDRRVGSILLLTEKFEGDWTKAFRFSEINPDFFVYRPKGLDDMLPWDFIDHGIYKEHLIKEYKLALKGEESDICHMGECKRCGVCRV